MNFNQRLLHYICWTEDCWNVLFEVSLLDRQHLKMFRETFCSFQLKRKFWSFNIFHIHDLFKTLSTLCCLATDKFLTRVIMKATRKSENFSAFSLNRPNISLLRSPQNNKYIELNAGKLWIYLRALKLFNCVLSPFEWMNLKRKENFYYIYSWNKEQGLFFPPFYCWAEDRKKFFSWRMFIAWFLSLDFLSINMNSPKFLHSSRLQKFSLRKISLLSDFIFFLYLSRRLRLVVYSSQQIYRACDNISSINKYTSDEKKARTSQSKRR